LSKQPANPPVIWMLAGSRATWMSLSNVTQSVDRSIVNFALIPYMKYTLTRKLSRAILARVLVAETAKSIGSIDRSGCSTVAE